MSAMITMVQLALDAQEALNQGGSPDETHLPNAGQDWVSVDDGEVPLLLRHMIALARSADEEVRDSAEEAISRWMDDKYPPGESQYTEVAVGWRIYHRPMNDFERGAVRAAAGGFA